MFQARSFEVPALEDQARIIAVAQIDHYNHQPSLDDFKDPLGVKWIATFVGVFQPTAAEITRFLKF